MKKYFWLSSALASLAAITVLAQDTTPTAPAPTASSAATAESKPESPAKRPRRKATGIKSRVVLNPPANAVVKGGSVNVRGRPSFIGEVVGHVKKDETVTLLEEITLNHPPAEEPPRWYKIVMPTNIPVWVDGDYVDSATKTVKAHRINLRGGPGENYSVVGRLEKGAPIEEVRHEKGWLAITPPTNAFGYIAAELVEIQAAAAAPVAEAPAPTATTNTPETVAVAAPTTPVAADTNQPASATPATPIAPAPTAQSEQAQELAALHQATPTEPVAPPPATNATPVNEESPTPRIVTREGFVHKSYNIQSPTDYELHDIKTDALIEYLQPALPQNFKIYIGTRVTVTGPEVIDQRWPRTPVLQVQSVDLAP
ncbi:MAG TPA: SH3 domain-containing protein [Verrucomicrobiae bacterium]|jgi:uncharacterized protein YgiM (DUF1202 family)